MGGSLSSSRDSLSRSTLFPAPGSSYDEDDDWVRWIDDIPVYWVKVDRSRPTILYSHGNASDLGDVKPLVDLLASRLNVNVLAYEYPGYGIYDEYYPSEKACYRTIERVYHYLVEKQVHSIIIVGQSLGTGPSSWLASQLSETEAEAELCLLVLLTPFRSAGSVVSERMANLSYAVRTSSSIALDIFDNYYRLQSVTCPVQIIAAENDSVTPYRQALQLQTALLNPLPLVTLKGADHNDLFNDKHEEKTMAAIKAAIKATSS